GRAASPARALRDALPIWTTNGCTGGAPTAQVQWRAKARDALGRDWREKVEYRYEAGTDRLTQERYLERTPGGGLFQPRSGIRPRSEEHTSELQSRENLVW